MLSNCDLCILRIPRALNIGYQNGVQKFRVFQCFFMFFCVFSGFSGLFEVSNFIVIGCK